MIAPGDLVVRVKPSFPLYPRYYDCEIGPVKGHVYTIRDIESADGEVWVRLEEIVNPPMLYAGGLYYELSFNITSFRPVRTDTLDIFRTESVEAV